MQALIFKITLFLLLSLSYLHAGPKSLSINDMSALEGDSGTTTLTFTLTATDNPRGGEVVNYTTSDGTATTSDNDYVAQSGSVTFSAGDKTETFSITINGDTSLEGDETFNVTISLSTSSVSITNISDATGVGTITNDDAGNPPTFTGTIPDQSEDINVAYSLDLSVYFTETEGHTITYSDSINLPTGITLNSTTGVLSGTPTVAGAYSNIVITATDSDGSVDSNSFTFTIESPPTVDLLLTENIVPSPATADIAEDIDISIQASNIGALAAQANTMISITYNQDVNITSASQINGSDFNCTQTSGLLSLGSPLLCVMNTDLTSAAGNKDFTFTVQATSYGTLIQTAVISSASTDSDLSNNTLISTSVPILEPGYCESIPLLEGFHIIDPDGGDDSNAYEIYCDMTSAYAPRELIALPLKNNYNNFVFEDDSPSFNYYDEADNAIASQSENSFNFLQIRISGSTIEVVPDSFAEGSSNEGYFSNINLIGTPFAIDWSNTTLSNCDVSKLRTGAWDQAVKIDTLDYTNGRCKVDSMSLKLLDEYQYLTYADIQGTNGSYGDEILEETCRQIFEKVPDDATHLPTLSGASNGYFWIDPDKGGRNGGSGGDSVDTQFRPFVAYCKYQDDIEQAWTFVMALDGKVTNSRLDIKTMDEVRANPAINHDTCSQLGLLFFVPNTKDTFTRTQSYLSTNKSEWIDYTGTVREKFQMYGLATEYYRQGEGFNEIWPYGPFGVYHPYGGDRNIDNTTLNWGAGSNTPMGDASGRCMNSGTGSGAVSCSDYTQRLAAVPNDDGSLGAIGWRTTLMDQVAAGLQGITDGDQWWIADVGAGNYIHNDGANSGTPECSITSPGSNRGTSGACDNIYYEPNGNYDADAWLNFIADSNGNVYHNDDWDDNYPYYDYMCMSWDNYYGFTRYGLTEGPFTVIEHDNPAIDTSGGYPITTPSDLNISTQVVQEGKEFDILLLSDNRAEIIDDQNVSAGVFLTKIETEDSGGITINTFTDLRYYGQIGTADNFDLVANPRGVIALNDALSTINKANQRLAFQFRYCGYSDVWTNCWDVTGSGDSTQAICKTGYGSLGIPNSPCQVADSNDFALRPNNFAIASTDGVISGSTLIVKANDVTINYRANDFAGNPTADYNTSFGNLNTDVILINSGLTCSTSFLEDTNQSTYAFSDGIDSHASILSDVGIYNFVLEEINGQEYAVIDAADTNWTRRQIAPNTISLTIKPNHFALSGLQNPNFNTDGNFTYLAKTTDMDAMAAKVEFTITAQNHTNGTTENYTDACYASNVNLDINYTVSAGTAANTIHYKVGTAAASNNTVSDTLGGSFIKSTEIVPKSVFSGTVNGDANINVKFNFDREIDVAKNPFTINLNNLNVSDQNTALIVNTTNQTINNDATFVYGRAAGPKRASFTNCVDNPTNCTSANESPRIVFQIYRDQLGNNVPALNGATHDGTQDSRWWTSPFHDINNILTDGNVTIPSTSITEVTGANISQSALTEESNFRYRAELHYNGNDGYVKEGHLKHTPSPWLVYNPDDATATFNTFSHNFIVEGWSGKNESGVTTDTKSANRTSKRILW